MSSSTSTPALTVPPRVLAIVQAGGAGGRLDVLTAERAKPALAFAGSYQLLDFPLSNLVNSQLSDVWLSIQYQAVGLGDQVRNGRPWDLDRTDGGLRLVVPQQGLNAESGPTDEEGFATGNADELYRLRDDVREHAPDLVLVLSADHVYRLDFRELIERHHSTQAELTMVTTDLDGVFGEDPADHAVVVADEAGLVQDVAYKPDRPRSSVVATEMFLYDAQVLVEVLEDLHARLSRERSASADDGPSAGDSGLGDFGDHLVPELVSRGRTWTLPLQGYWRDLGQPHHYLNAHLDLLAEDALDATELFDPSWPVRTQQPQRVPAVVLGGAEVDHCLLSPGARVSGSVTRSVLGPGVVVEEGATVLDSVLLADTVVCAGARVERAIVDSGCVIEETAVVGSAGVDLADPASIPMVGRDSRVSSSLPPGARLAPGSSD